MHFQQKLRFWIPPLVWLAVISFFSTDLFSSEHTGRVLRSLHLLRLLSQLEFDRIHFLIRETAHLTEYAVLSLLFFRSWCCSSGKQLKTSWKWTWAACSVLMSMMMALIDEFHQTFVSSRSSSFRDVALDTMGALFSIVLIRMYVSKPDLLKWTT